MAVPNSEYITVNRILVFAAVILFILAALGVGLGSINLVAAGLALWASANLF